MEDSPQSAHSQVVASLVTKSAAPQAQDVKFRAAAAQEFWW